MRDINTNELLRLVAENPELPIVAMVDTECVAGDYCDWWSAKIGKPTIDEYYAPDDRMYLKSLDLEDMVDEFIDSNYDEEPYKSMTEKELEQEAKRVVNGYAWTKAIMLPIEP